MTLHIRISGFEFTPDYFTKLLGCIHKWMGENNEEHGRMSLYAFSHVWKENYFYFSCWDRHLCVRVMQGINDDPHMWGAVVAEHVDQVKQTSLGANFRTTSPIFAKRDNKHLFNADAELVCREILLQKAKTAGVILPDFELKLTDKKDKLIKIHDISNRCAHYNVYISNPKVAEFALCVGLGSCTGVGFGHIMPKLH